LPGRGLSAPDPDIESHTSACHSRDTDKDKASARPRTPPSKDIAPEAGYDIWLRTAILRSLADLAEGR